MKRALILFVPLILFIILSVLGVLWWRDKSEAPSQDPSLSNFVITRGSAASQVGRKLEEQGFIKSSLAFKIYIQVTSKAKKVPAGEYRLPKNLGLSNLISELEKGPAEIWVTIPEGLRREEILGIFTSEFVLKGEEKEAFENEFMELSKESEGYLFPDSYLFPRTVKAKAVFDKLRTTFDLKVDEEMKADIPNGFSLNEIITLASILERETKSDEERPIVAGILVKRLNAGWPLQADASVQYGVASTKCKGKIECEWWPILTKEDLDISSKFNTYKYTSLPPGPIANPGLSSIKGAIYQEESPYWFYIHDPEGTIHYAATIEEHNSNIRKYLGK